MHGEIRATKLKPLYPIVSVSDCEEFSFGDGKNDPEIHYPFAEWRFGR